VHDTLSQVHVTDPRPQHPTPVNTVGTVGFRAGGGWTVLGAAQIKKGNTP
jgi:hypothetical protein